MGRAAAGLALFVLAVPGAARAYLMDAYDANAIGRGAIEAELQPLGYYHYVTLQEDEHYLVTPSMLLYVGVAPRLDVIVSGRGYLLLDDIPDYPRYHSREAAVSLRWLVREGSYQDGEGPSLSLHAGLLLPNLHGGETAGGALGVAATHSGDGGTVYANVFASRTPWRSWEVFVPITFEGPPDWSVRPTLETWLDWDSDYGVLVSMLGGINIDLGERAIFSAGARFAQYMAGELDGDAEIEVRASVWVQLRPPQEDASGDGEGGSD